MTTSSEAARDLSYLAHEARRRNTAAVRRIVNAYRRTHPGRRTNSEILESVATEFEERATSQTTAAAS